MNKEGAALQQVADIFVCHLVSSFGDLIAPQHHVPIRAPCTGSHDLFSFEFFLSQTSNVGCVPTSLIRESSLMFVSRRGLSNTNQRLSPST